MSSGGYRTTFLSTEAETTIEVLHLATHKPRHYLYAMLAHVVYYSVFVVVFIHFSIIDNDSSDIAPFMSLYSEILPVLQI